MEKLPLSSLTSIYADLHIHIGRTKEGLPVKITASQNMTFTKIIHEAYVRKGLQMIGVIDAHSPPVQQEILEGLYSGDFEQHPDGGIQYRGVTCLLGAEIEIKEPNEKPAHVLAYFPTIEQICDFTRWLKGHMKNVQLSTQRLYQSATILADQVCLRDGILIPAHIFTPFKSILGSATNRLANVFKPNQIAGVELGLSSDSYLADRLSELHSLTFLTNSDAHSIPNIGREYNEFLMKEASFKEWESVLQRKNGRKVTANYGLDPRLGKYYRSRCKVCDCLWSAANHMNQCPECGSLKRVKGVRDRIEELADQSSESFPSPLHRPPYIYQIPLRMFPGLGPKTLEKLLCQVGSEMYILHRAKREEIVEASNERVADQILLAREQKLELIEGGGGKYGKIKH